MSVIQATEYKYAKCSECTGPEYQAESNLCQD